jgi:geranylgeranyl pyrophosphate synthase
LHDDIIDESKTKYGAPTVYGKFGAEASLLLGNAFLIEGFTLLADSLSGLSKDAATAATKEYKKLLFEVGNAHALEIALKERHPTANGYMKIIEMKAAGIEADMHLGAVFGGGNHFEVEILSRIGRILGTLATLRDEFVDVFEIDELRQRISTRSLPLPILLALKEEDVEERIKTILSKPEMTRKDADKLLDIVFHSKPVMNLKEQMEDKKKEGMQLTRSLGNTGLRKKFYAIFEVMLEDL